VEVDVEVVFLKKLSIVPCLGITLFVVVVFFFFFDGDETKNIIRVYFSLEDLEFIYLL
jgi:hypothetical protein